jgi:hypothetical protein
MVLVQKDDIHLPQKPVGTTHDVENIRYSETSFAKEFAHFRE